MVHVPSQIAREGCIYVLIGIQRNRIEHHVALSFLLFDTPNAFGFVDHLAAIFDHKSLSDYVLECAQTHTPFSNFERTQLWVVSGLKASIAAFAAGWACARIALDVAETIEARVVSAWCRRCAYTGRLIIFVSLLLVWQRCPSDRSHNLLVLSHAWLVVRGSPLHAMGITHCFGCK
jgi:hypothetical protein